MSSAQYIRSPYHLPSIRSHFGSYITFTRRLALYYSIFVVLCLLLGYQHNGFCSFLVFLFTVHIGFCSLTCSLPSRQSSLSHAQPDRQCLFGVPPIPFDILAVPRLRRFLSQHHCPINPSASSHFLSTSLLPSACCRPKLIVCPLD